MARPSCTTCVRRRLQCPGYEDVGGFHFRVETSGSYPSQSRRRNAESGERSEPLTIRRRTTAPARLITTAEDVLPRPSDLSSNVTGFVVRYFTESLVQIDSRLHGYRPEIIDRLCIIYNDSRPDSSSRFAFYTLAGQLTASALRRDIGTPWQIQQLYGAVRSIQDSISNPIQTEDEQDQTLLAVIILGFAASLQSAIRRQLTDPAHYLGAVALVRQRFRQSEPLSPGFVTLARAVRRGIITCVHGSSPEDQARLVEVIPDLESAQMTEQTTAQALESLILQAILLKQRVQSLTAGSGVAVVPETIVAQAHNLHVGLQQWGDQLPDSWHPLNERPSSSTESASTGEAWSSTDIAGSYNHWRCAQILVTRLSNAVAVYMQPSQHRSNDAANAVERLVGEILAAGPFFTDQITSSETTASDGPEVDYIEGCRLWRRYEYYRILRHLAFALDLGEASPRIPRLETRDGRLAEIVSRLQNWQPNYTVS